MPCGVGIWIGHAGDNTITHYDIPDLFYSAISSGWRWGDDQSLAARNQVRFNRLHHLGWGLLSDMDRTGVLVENNLVYNTRSGGYHQHYGRDNIIRNNTFANATDQQLQSTRVEDHQSFTFSRNIIHFSGGRLLHGPWTEANIAIDHNLYFHTSGDTPAYHSGTARCAFELHLEADSSFSHEWRDNASPCLAGPGLSIDKGTLQLPGGHTLPLPPGQSIRFGIETAPGPDATGTWSPPGSTSSATPTAKPPFTSTTSTSRTDPPRCFGAWQPRFPTYRSADA